MRRKDKEITDKIIIEDILSKSEICRIAMIDGNEPYLLPFNYGYYNNAIYMHSATSGRKIDILKANNRVCFEIEQSSKIVKKDLACDWTTQYRSVVGYGHIEIINDLGAKVEGLDIVMKHYGKTDSNVYNEKLVNNIVILKLEIEKLTAKQSGDWS